ncbi:MAG: GTPase Era [Defluviitaleaceae bacterium]|nr:GTPase Era [Defluviitaleaceae bacterium]
MTKFNSGFVSIIGRPNVGKSTLMNRLLGEKVAIVTNKPQTTRNQIRGVLTEDDYQAVFIDTPGIHRPKSKLGEYMTREAESSLDAVDVVLFVVEPSANIGPGDMFIIERLKHITDSSVFLVINKIDNIAREKQLAVIDAYRGQMDFDEIIPISATRGDNTDALQSAIKARLPEGPKYFPDDTLTDQPERLIAAELIREKLLILLDDELPHGTAVEITAMKERPGKNLIDMDATIYCERASHKGMIIGKQGAKLKSVGARARADIERLLGTPVYLQLWVKVKKNWRDSDFMLRSFGYRGS